MPSHAHPPVTYTAAQASRLAGCGVSQLEAWRRVGLLTPDDAETYSFRDLVALRMVTALLAEGVPTRRIRRAVEALLGAGDDIASLSLVSDGDTVLACRGEGEVLDALRHGQLALFVSVGRLAQDVDAEVQVFTADRASFLDALSAPG